MSFPSNWAQVWVSWPTDTHLRFSGIVNWYTFEPFVDFPDAVEAEVSAYLLSTRNISNYLLMINPGIAGPLTTRVYINTPTHGVYYFTDTTGFVEPGFGLDPLPMEDCVVVQRWTDTPGRSGRGRIYVPGVPKISVTDPDILTPVAHAFYEAYCQDMLQTVQDPFRADAPLFTPVLVSYKNKVALPLTRITVNWRLGMVKRRRRQRKNPIPPTFPKATP